MALLAVLGVCTYGFILKGSDTIFPNVYVAGVNVGGGGTPIASLATLIVVSHFQSMAPGLRLSRRRFWGLLLGLNFACLAALLAVGCIAGW